MSKNENMALYNQVREVPQEAIKTIAAGKLKGFSDINPMWRIQVLTERFGVCGFGWYYTIDKQWTEVSNQIVKAFVNISLFVKMGNEWSKPIQGTGGSQMTAATKNGLEVSDECYKMALTDALSVACKALGIGADVYFSAGRTKYNQQLQEEQMADIQQSIDAATTTEELAAIYNAHSYLHTNANFMSALTARKTAILQNPAA